MATSEYEFGIVYLACPYTGSTQEEAHRVNMANSTAAVFLRNGITVISPLTYGSVLERYYGLPKTWDFWKEHCLTLVPCCDNLVILTIPGWDESIGVHEEYVAALDWTLPVWHATPDVRGDKFHVYLEGAEDKELPAMVLS